MTGIRSLIEQAAQGFQQNRTHGGVAFGQTHQAGEHDGAPLLRAERRPHPAAVLADDLVGEFLGVLRPYGAARAVPHTGGNAIDALTGGKGPLQDRPAPIQLGKPGGIAGQVYRAGGQGHVHQLPYADDPVIDRKIR